MCDTVKLPDAPRELVFCAEELPVLTGEIILPHREGKQGGRFNRYYQACADAFERCCRRELLPRAEAAYCRAVEDAVFEAGAKNVGLIDEPIAAAVGAGVQVSKARGAMLVDLGGGVSEAAVISLGGVVQSNSLRIAGDEMDLAIVSFLKQHRNLLIGEITAETLKRKLGTAIKGLDRGSMEVCGRDLRTGLARTVTVTTDEVRHAIREPLVEILMMVKGTLEETPPELAADIFDFGIVMVGGGALLPGMDQVIRAQTGIRVTVAKKPMDCVCMGLGRMLQSTGGDFSEFVRYKVK